MNVFEPEPVGNDWDEVRAELERAFVMSRDAARNEESFVYIVHHDDLLGKRGPGRAMVAAGLVSAARTAAIEGSRKGWAVNVVAYEDGVDRALVETWARRLVEQPDGVTGELIRIGSSHLGKTLP